MIGVPLNEPVQVGRKSTFEVFDEIRQCQTPAQLQTVGDWFLRPLHIETRDYTIYAAFIICI